MTELFTFNEVKYYNTKELKEENEVFFYGCKNNIRNIIKQKNIPEEHIFYAYKKGDNWCETTHSYSRATLFITEQWYNNYINSENPTKKIEMAPPIHTLDEGQKYKDIDGNDVNIQIRVNEQKRILF